MRGIVRNTSLFKITVVQAALTLSLGGPSFAANLSAPFSLESTQTLPSGVRNPRFLNVFTNIDTKYDNEGGLAPLGDRLNKRISWQDVLDAQSDESQKNLVKSVLADTNQTIDGSPGNASGVVKTYANVKVPVLAMGLSDKLTLGLVVPVVHIDVAVDSGFLRSENGQKFVDYICDSSPDKCNEAAVKLNSATQQKLARLGYEPLQSHQISGLGDIQLMSKYRWLEGSENGLATKLALILPTGTRTNPDRALDLTTGDNRFKAAAAVVYDRALPWGFRGTTHVGYTALLPSSLVKRLPTSADDSLSKDKEVVTRELGHQAIAAASLERPIPEVGLVVGAGLSSQYLSKTKYTGTSPDRIERYGLLGDLEPEQILHAATATLGFSTVNWYREKSFPLPFQLNASYSHPIGGRNAPRNDIFAGEMVLFF
jgi:hypothetical protein